MNYNKIVSSFDPGFIDQFRWIGLGDLLGSKDNHYQNDGFLQVFLNSSKTLSLIIAHENLTMRHLVGKNYTKI